MQRNGDEVCCTDIGEMIIFILINILLLFGVLMFIQIRVNYLASKL